MKLLKAAPKDRSYEQLKNHYLVEKAIADKLKKANREERKKILSTMYDELFEKVPDHPRLTRRKSERLTSIVNMNKMALINSYISKETTFVEVAPGDCRFAYEVASKVKWVYGVDISDQRNIKDNPPGNFKLILFDGFNLNSISDETVDVVFSDQLIEHLHVDDTKLHFELIYRILKPGGKYVFRTPNLLTGPHDVSQYFSYIPECFHLKEWTYHELQSLLKSCQYTEFQTLWNAKKISIRLPFLYFYLCEHIFGMFPKKYLREIANYFIPTLCGIAVK